MPIAVGIVVLTAVFFFARLTSDSAKESVESERLSTSQTEPAANPAPAASAIRSGQTQMDETYGSGSSKGETTVAEDIQPARQELVNGPVSRVEPATPGGEPANLDTDMPGLVIYPAGSAGGTSGPSQDDFGMPGPTYSDGNSADSGPSSPAPEAVPEGSVPPLGIDPVEPGPSQVDLGLPGPGQAESGLTDPSGTEGELKEDRVGDQPLPSR
jgi:hypothetical protein